MGDPIFAQLNEEQTDAVETVRGPVCILAGAGSGKTTTITRRIANQVATHTFSPGEILAVTFTEKAAREMAGRLAALGVQGVRARTFHAEALAQYRRFAADRSDILSSKGQILVSLVGRLPPPHRFTALRDVATEIEWAKNRRIRPEEYLERVGDRGPPLPQGIMAGVYAAYERAKARANLMDFEDLLARTIDLLAGDERVLSIVRSRYQTFTVDEYQDVNLLQQTLLEAWLGDREGLCVVGDDYQSIYGFTGATAHYLLTFPDRFPGCRVVRLTRNYRSSPQVLGLANRLVPRLRGSAKTLRPVCEPGPEPVVCQLSTAQAEVAWIVERARALHTGGTPWEEIAVLHRINGRSEELEEALTAADIPYQVRGGAFLRRPAARGALARLRRAASREDGGTEPGAVAAVVEETVMRLGYREDADLDDLPEEEATRQADLARLRALARSFDAPGGIGGFLEDLRRRFAVEEDGRGIQILTYHRAKGLEFEAVFLPRLEDKELPFALARGEEEEAEERRLLYVGITRAKRHLLITWARTREGERRRFPRPSPFLAELGLSGGTAGGRSGESGRRVAGSSGVGGGRAAGNGAAGSAASAGAGAAQRAAGRQVPESDRDLFDALREWRLRRARGDEVPAYVVFNDDTLARIAGTRPTDTRTLLGISGVGPAKLARYGEEVLTLVRRHSNRHTA